MDEARFPEIVRSIYGAVAELEAMFPGRKFTPDGHMVGSLGEAYAAHHYGIMLHGASFECHDGTCNGKNVQVKATQGDRVAVSAEPEQLLVLRLHRDGSFTEVYNGLGSRVWSLVAHKPRPKNGQYQVSVAALGRLMAAVPEQERLDHKASNPSFKRTPDGAA
ncbi:hypothetical protein B2J86_11025 [Acidovorax sp. SRB_14]|uniref:DUF6998 domain-containing protein n=1 Tax=Acidovorax sp. SRB_14 TaxID=1962699 RepID=UPI00156693C3|nr:hypothetical protein [Acidovorax sp. SRB_14]NMM81446.1 hypothetical protein [Acidovorax sp. SRB_14]